MTWLMWDTEQKRLVESRVLPALTASISSAGDDVAAVEFRVVTIDEEGRFDFRAYHQRQARSRELGAEIIGARETAHAKHGDDSIEGMPADDPRWLTVLVEEVGEVAHALTYDSVDRDVYPHETERLRIRRQMLEAELVDVLAVAAAWLDASRMAREPVDTTRSDAEAANDTRPTS